MNRLRRIRPYSCAVIWFAISVTAFWALTIRSYVPGAVATAPRVWPAATSLTRDHAACTAVVFVHPLCGCTRATLAEVARLTRQLGDDSRWIIVVDANATSGLADLNTSVVRLARGISKAEVYLDFGGVETARFQARTSGEVQLFDTDGQLQFHGGVTPARGHEGVSVGRLAIADWVSRRQSPVVACNTYGCLLSAATKAQP